jgi:hypothetical protein
MKTRAYFIVITCLLGAGLAHAGFQSPIEESGTVAKQIEATPHPVEVVSSYKRVMPDRAAAMHEAVPAPSASATAAASAAAKASFYGPALPANVKAQPAPVAKASSPVPQNTKAAPGTSPLSHAPFAKPNVVKPLEPPKSVKSARQEPAKLPARMSKPSLKEALRGPIPKAPALPNAPAALNVPAVSLPHASDGLISPESPEKLSLKGMNRPMIHAFLKHARELKMPEREYGTTVNSRAIAEQYKAALHPEPGKSFRTKYSLGLAKIAKIQEPPSVTQYENMVKRIDSLFDALDLRYALSVKSLWELAESATNARDLQARDALFAGLLSTRAGWETTAAMMLEEAAAKRVEKDDRYLKILWNQLELVKNPVHLDKIVADVSPRRVLDASPAGDNANYAMAKRLLQQKFRAPALVPPSSDAILQRITSKDLRDKLTVLELVGKLRSKTDSKRLAAMDGLRAIESSGSEENSQQARLALARTLLQHGQSAEALAFYKNVAKNRKNRLAVLGEQSYAEYANGEYQEALGKTVAMETPSFQYGFAPDVHLVEIMSRKALCDFGGAEDGVKRFNDRYAPELAALDHILARKLEAAEFYEELVNAAEAEKPMRYQRFLLQLSNVMENQKTMNAALSELEKLDQLGTHQKSLERPENWDGFTAAMRARWTARAQELRRGSAKAALEEVAYLAQRLRGTFAQVELLDLDISTAASKNYNLQSALNFPVAKQDEEKLDEHRMRWPFDEELWEDEIDFMKAKNPSKCAVAKTASL